MPGEVANENRPMPEREELVFAIDASLRVHTRADLSGWYDVELQALVDKLAPYLDVATLRSHAGGHTTGTGEGANRPPPALTSRERQVLKWACVGKTNIEIGMILGISALTVKNHMQKTFRKLNVSNRTQAAVKACALHIVSE